MPASRHIVVLCTRLDLPGGIERAIVHTAGLWSGHGHKVTLLVLDDTTESFYPLAPTVEVICLPLHFGITEKGNPFSRKWKFIRHIRELGQALKRLGPDVVIATEYPMAVAAFLARPGRKYRLLAWEHHHFHFLQKNRFWRHLVTWVYPRLYGVVTLNRTEQQLYAGIGCKAYVIPNFVVLEPAANEVVRDKELLTIGWLIHRKGADLIPEIAKLVLQRFPGWRWRIVGEGPEQKNLQSQLEQYGLQDRVQIQKPVSSEVTHLYRQASVFVLPSRFECFPMVLLEALSNGLPCVTFDCPTGPADIIRHNEDGLLVEKENVAAMTEALCALLEDEAGRKKMGEKAQENIRRFSPGKVYQLWEQLFRSES